MNNNTLAAVRNLVDETTKSELDICRSMIDMHRTEEDQERFKDLIWAWRLRRGGVEHIRRSLLNRLTRMINNT